MEYIEIVDADFMNTGQCVTQYKDTVGNLLPNFIPNEHDTRVELKHIHFD